MIQDSDMLKFCFLWITYGCNVFCGLRQRRCLSNGTAWFRHHRCVYHWGGHLVFNSVGCECRVQDPCERKGVSVSVYRQLATHCLFPLNRSVTRGCVWTAQSATLCWHHGSKKNITRNLLRRRVVPEQNEPFLKKKQHERKIFPPNWIRFDGDPAFYWEDHVLSVQW